MPKSSLQKRKHRSQEPTPLEGAWGNQAATRTGRSGLVLKPKKVQPLVVVAPAEGAGGQKNIQVPTLGDSSPAGADGTTCMDYLQSIPELAFLVRGWAGGPRYTGRYIPLVSDRWNPDLESYRTRTPSNPKSDIIGAQQHPSVMLVLLMRHYPWIVYLGYSFWRKLLVMLPAGTEPSAHPPLTVPTNKLKIQHLGACGNIKSLHPRMLLGDAVCADVKSRRHVLASVFAKNRHRECLSLLTKLEDEKVAQSSRGENRASPSRFFFLNWQDVLLDAIRGGNTELCRSLLESNRASSSPSSGGDAAPLAVAIEHRNPELVRLLLDFQAPVDKAVRTSGGGTWSWLYTQKTPRQLAYENRDTECLKVLYDGGAKKMTLRDIMMPLSPEGYLSLHGPCLRFVLEQAEPSVDGTAAESEYATTHLIMCLRKVASSLHLEKPLEIGLTPEESAARHIAKRAQQAAEEGVLLELAQMLVVKFGANVDSVHDGHCTLLHRAVLTRSVGVVRFLLEHGADVNFQDLTSLKTPLHHAVTIEHLPWLLPPPPGETPSSTAPKYGVAVAGDATSTTSVAAAAAAAGTRQSGGPVLVGVGAVEGQIIQWLLSYGAKGDVRDKGGRCPMHDARFHKQTHGLAELLLTSHFGATFMLPRTRGSDKKKREKKTKNRSSLENTSSTEVSSDNKTAG